MKSASFGSSTHVKWQGWVSPDLECPPKTSAGDALVKDVDEIRKASGLAQTPLRLEGRPLARERAVRSTLPLGRDADTTTPLSPRSRARRRASRAICATIAR